VPDTPRNIHLLGICGTAMAALAGSLHALGYRVTGTDEHVYPPMSDLLRRLGIAFSEGYRPGNIPPDAELVIVGNVIRESNPEAAEMRRRGLLYVSMAEAVQRFIIRARSTIAVVGTHGKTTTTALLAHLLVELGADPGFLIGGIARNFDSNFRVGSGSRFVIEGDEYDTAYFDKTPKFFKYRPTGVIFTSLEYDHADIYPDLDAIRVQFGRLLAGLPAAGVLVACADDANVAALLPQAACPAVTYGFSAGADCVLSDWQPEGEGARFTAAWRGTRRAWSVPLPGRHNALNTAAALLMAQWLGYAPERLQAALGSFRGVKRRQEVRGEADGVTVLDDFAHHPTAVRETLAAMRARYPGRRLWAVFEPRSFTARSPRFQADWPGAFLGADRVLIAPAFLGSGGGALLDTTALATAIGKLGTPAESAATNDDVLARLAAQVRAGDVVLMMSNGGFDDLHERLLSALRARAAPAAPQAALTVPGKHRSEK
jgi:UDP-N-acetylmuramate: L-alanyl-gamma-D-glutamyl-meso-diaminopimelate ligase